MNRISRAWSLALAVLTFVVSNPVARAADRIYVLKSSGNGFRGETPEERAKRLSTHIDKVVLGDLKQILKDRYLRVLTTKNPYDYYVHNGEMKGVQYEMVRSFVRHLNKKYVKEGELKIAFEMVPVDFDQLFPMLNAGKGDIIAVGLTRTEKRDARAEFTLPYQVADDVIVTRTELARESWKGKTFVIQKDSSYAETIAKSGQPVSLREVDANLNAENLMELVSLKNADYTLVNSYWAEKLSKRFTNITILKEKPFRKRVSIRWAVRKKNPRLLHELNAFMPKVRKGRLLANSFTNKYFDDLSRLQSKDFSLEAQRISKYDDPMKKYAGKYGFDWRLLAAQCLQESRFEQDIVNKWGAIGLFQVKQSTANEPYIRIRKIRGPKNYDNNIHAGVKYLSWLKKNFFDNQAEMLEEDRLRLMLAAYNAGPSRVQEAIAKTKEMGLDPKVWFRNVELGMLELGVSEPVIYVSEINKHYVGYLLMGIR